MAKVCFFFLFWLNISFIHAEPALSAWLNSTGYTGYLNQLTNCIGIYYSTNYVYIQSTSIPSYSIGPSWLPDPNNASQKNMFNIYPRYPSQNTG